LFLSYVLNSETFQQFDGFEKLSDFEIDLNYRDNSTRLRTELADEPACSACGEQERTGENQPGWQTKNSDFRKTGEAPDRKLATASRSGSKGS